MRTALRTVVLATLISSLSSSAQDSDDDQGGTSVTVEYVDGDSPVVSTQNQVVKRVASPDAVDEQNFVTLRRNEEIAYISYIRRKSSESGEFLILDVVLEDNRTFCYEVLPLPAGASRKLCVRSAPLGAEENSMERIMLHLGAVYFIGFDDGVVNSRDLALQLEFASAGLTWGLNGGR